MINLVRLGEDLVGEWGEVGWFEWLSVKEGVGSGAAAAQRTPSSSRLAECDFIYRI